MIKYRKFKSKANIFAKFFCFVWLSIAVYWRTFSGYIEFDSRLLLDWEDFMNFNCIRQWLAMLKHQILKMFMSTFFYLQNASSRFLEYVHNCNIIKRKLLRYLNVFWNFWISTSLIFFICFCKIQAICKISIQWVIQIYREVAVFKPLQHSRCANIFYE